MESLRNLNDLEIQRASILSAQRLSKKDAESIEPKDKYGIVHLVFFFFGLGSFLSMSFFLTANDYWMFKFRDASQKTYDSNNKTTLQTYFATSTGIAQSVTGLITTWLLTFLGHKIHIRLRILGTLAIMVLSYTLFTIFIEVNTDSWQEIFFGLTMIFYVILGVSSTMLNMVVLNLTAKFPPRYMKTQMYGQGGAGLFSSILQVISLAIGGSTTSAALFYFICGTSVLVITLVLGIISEYSPLFRFYIGDTMADQDRKVYTFPEMQRVAKIVWPCIFVLCSMIFTMSMGQPNITSLVVSENYGNGNLWNDKYFVPVITFFSSEVFSLLGRWLARPILTRKIQIPFLIVYIIRLILLSPIFMFCNASPRHHLPIWFPHDWEYILLLAICSTSGSYILASTFLSLPSLAGPDTEIGFMVMQSMATSVATVMSFISPLFIKAM